MELIKDESGRCIHLRRKWKHVLRCVYHSKKSVPIETCKTCPHKKIETRLGK